MVCQDRLGTDVINVKKACGCLALANAAAAVICRLSAVISNGIASHAPVECQHATFVFETFALMSVQSLSWQMIAFHQETAPRNGACTF
jgi:hypothetical protein